ncbi:MAG: HNH endonuclease signature motif containing protein, partial [Blastocatellia bacterium]
SRLYEQDPPSWIDWNMIRRRKLQYRITGYNLQVTEVEGDLGDIIDLFVRINSTGKALTGQEKRNARYYHSPFLRKAGQLAKRLEEYFRSAKILSPMQISRMKHVELVCELMVSAHSEGVINKKVALDKVMDSDSIRGRNIDKAAGLTVTCLNRLKRMFPKISQTRFSQLSDFYSLAVLIQRFERQGLVLTDARRNRLAWDLLVAFSTGIDKVRILQKKIEASEPGQEIYRDYLVTVREGTDKIEQRKKRMDILRGLLEPLFQKKDSARSFSQEQRRILWNSTTTPRCSVGNHALTWDDFTIDHVDPWSKGGRTDLENAALMCRRHNSGKGNRRRRKIAA